ncbi:hypothetical protein [Methylosinus sporium]|uniref:Uncharacterized protein n=1 Tax=Methylosinus sporium TaxID=428 RepID=A0A2U1STH9_METSR|nr:hypothetical protein [Methylosinus sporium]PWB94926.1 hypothetical protein C5689_05640 [Methylosinus sporium]
MTDAVKKLKDLGDGSYADVVSTVDWPGQWDYLENTYSGTNLTQTVYKIGGSGGTIIGTLTMTYDASGNLLTVTRS